MSQWILQQRAMMDFERYGLTDSPFGGPGGREFVLVSSRAAQLHRIEQCLRDGQGIAILTGSSGLGKTTLCRKLADRLHPDWLVANLCDAGFTTRRSLLQAILYELGLPYTGLTEQEARLHLVDAIHDRQPHKGGLILIVDEAQRLNDRLLEELRSLINHEHDGSPLVRLLLCGDLVLEERLITPALEGVNQRVVCHEILEPLTYEESAQLIEEKLTRAGGDGWEHVFTRPAMELLCLVSDGSPRNLEQLAKRSLQVAAQRREPRITVESVRESLEELKELPLQWNEPANLDAFAAREQRIEACTADDADLLLHTADVTEADDAVAVEVGDELPTADWESVLDESLPPAAVYEVGGEADLGRTSLREESEDSAEPELDLLFTRGSHEANLLLDDDSPGLADTAILETGARQPAAVNPEASPSAASAVYETSPDEAGEALDEEASVILPAHPAESGTVVVSTAGEPDWTEFAIDDAYAALDARVSPGAPSTAPRPAVGESQTESVPALAPCEAVRLVEEEILDDVQELSQQVARAMTSAVAAAEPPNQSDANRRSAPDAPSGLEGSPWVSGHSQMPEWDVIQPEWVSEGDRSTSEGSDSPDSISSDDRSDLAEASDESGANGELRHDSKSAERGADIEPSPIGPDASASPAMEPAPNLQHRVDSGDQRPYSQLFSRLRRLRSKLSQRSDSGV